MTSATRARTFDEDLAFLSSHGRVLVLSDEAGAKVALSALYQGRVMTSVASGSARSLGWVHRDFIEAGRTGTQFDNYGGEDRFWLGPEGGQFGFYFRPGSPFTFDEWHAPAALQEGAWDVVEEGPERVVFARSMTLTSWSRTSFRVDVERTARIVVAAEAAALVGLPAVASDVGYVGFETCNRIRNVGAAPWRRATGLPSIWILGMFAPAKDARVVIPFEPGPGELVNDRYFGEVPPDRLRVDEDARVVVFSGDGEVRGKIGLGPARAKGVLGSHSAESGLLTLVQYDGPRPGAPYVNSMWEPQSEPYAGDVVNAYNDGPPAPGRPRLGGFYEIETSSPGAELEPGAELVHTHRTLHFVGDARVLEPIARRALGVGLDELA